MMHLCKCDGVADPQNTPLTIRVTMPNLVILHQQCVGKNKGNPQNWEVLRLNPWDAGRS